MANFAQDFIRKLIPKQVSNDIDSVFLTVKVYQSLGKYTEDKATQLKSSLADAVFSYVGSFASYTKSTDGLGILVSYLMSGITPNEILRQQVISIRTQAVGFLQTKGEIIK